MVAEVGSHGMQIFDLNRLKTLDNSPPPVRFNVNRHIDLTDHYKERVKDAHSGNNVLHEKQFLNASKYYNISLLTRESVLFDFVREPSLIPDGYAQNLFIHEARGYAYVVGTSICNGGLYIFDLNSSPYPEFAGCYNEDGFISDVQCVVSNGKDVCFACTGSGLSIIDTTDKTAATRISRLVLSEFDFIAQGLYG